jgi:DnaA family protein
MAQQLILDILPPAQPSFQNMVLGANAQAVAAAQTIEPGQTLYIWGPDGSGRSHLLAASAAHWAGAHIAPASASSAIEQLLELPNPPKLVAVDDVHKLDDPARAALFGLYNRWRECASSEQAFGLVVAGNQPPLGMQCREDLRTRLGWGAVYRLEPLSDEQKLTALEQYAQAQSMPLSAEVLHWLLTHGSRDIRALFAVLDALDRYALAHHRPLTLPLLKSMMAKLPPSPT